MTRYTLRRDGEKPLAFNGKLVGEVSTRFKRDRWTELRLYLTTIDSEWRPGPHGRLDAYVVEQVGRSKMDGEIDRCKAWVCRHERDVRSALGKGQLAQQLYLEAGLDGAEDVSAWPRDDQGERT